MTEIKHRTHAGIGAAVTRSDNPQSSERIGACRGCGMSWSGCVTTRRHPDDHCCPECDHSPGRSDNPPPSDGIQRYEYTNVARPGSYEQHYDMRRHADGEWVMYDDHVAENATLRAEIVERAAEKDRLLRKLDDFARQRDSLRAELETARREAAKADPLRLALNDKQAEIHRLTAELAERTRERNEANDAANRYCRESHDARRQVAERDERIAGLEQRLDWQITNGGFTTGHQA